MEEKKCCANCRHFTPFSTLFRDGKEPKEKGVCTINALFRKWSVELMIVSQDGCCVYWEAKE